MAPHKFPAKATVIMSNLLIFILVSENKSQKLMIKPTFEMSPSESTGHPCTMVSLLQPSLLANLCRVCIRRRSTSKRPNGRRLGARPSSRVKSRSGIMHGGSRGPPAASPVQSQVSAIPVLMQFACMSLGVGFKFGAALAGGPSCGSPGGSRLAVLYRDLGKPWQ